VGFVRGFLAPFRGALFIAQQRLWRYLLLPLLINIGLALATLWGAAIFLRQEFDGMIRSTPVLGWIGLVAITGVLGAVLFIVLQPVLGAIFNDRLSARVETQVRGKAAEAPFLLSTGQAIGHGLLKLLLYAVALVIGMVLTTLTGIGSVIGLGLGAIFLAYDGFDFPLSRRGKGFAAKWGYLGRHPAMALGFGVGATVLYFIPLAFVVAPPFAAAGATLVFLDADARAEARAARRAQRAQLKAARRAGAASQKSTAPSP